MSDEQAPKNQKSNSKQIDTRLAKGLVEPEEHHGFLHAPKYRGSTVLFPDMQSLRAHSQQFTYGTNTPTTAALCDELNELEGAAGTVLTPNGLSAITLPLLSLLSAGDHALIIDSCYGPTRRFCDTIGKRFGIEVDYFAPEIGADISKLIKQNTKIVFTEAPGSNCFAMTDVPLIAKTAKQTKSDIAVMMDNTWATPLFFKPLDHGVDISIHALTKYPAGHGDLLLGAVSSNEIYVEQIKRTNNDLGLCVGSEEAHLVLRGLKTMGIRLRHHYKSALHLAKWLEGRDEVARVIYPALASDPGHQIWSEQYGGAAGLFSIALKTSSDNQACDFVEALELFGMGYSWAGHESLALIPTFADRTLSRPEDEGIIVRLQIGLEDVADLQADIEQAFMRAQLS